MEPGNQFYISKITNEILEKINGKSYKTGCPVPLQDLRYIHVLHKDLEGYTLEGEMICNTYIANGLLEIFEELYKANYPIEKIRLIDEYDAHDEKSMEDNNSSCFNFRFVSHTSQISKHGLGLAVDINTLYNPYIKKLNNKTIIEPVTAEPYTNRDSNFTYKIVKNDLCYNLFTSHGFEWGGDWENRKDYQHFEIPTSVVNKLYPKSKELRGSLFLPI